MLNSLLISNIRSLVQTEDLPKSRVCGMEMSHLNAITDAFLYIREGIISDFGTMAELLERNIPVNDPGLKHIDAVGKLVFPSFCDSHTHLGLCRQPGG